MNPKWKKKWINALISGEYRQGKGELRPSQDTYCCLGVLTDLVMKETPEAWWETHDGAYCAVFGTERERAMLPGEVAARTGLGRNNPNIEGHFLSDYNDSHNASFEDIADLIDRGL